MYFISLFCQLRLKTFVVSAARVVLNELIQYIIIIYYKLVLVMVNGCVIKTQMYTKCFRNKTDVRHFKIKFKIGGIQVFPYGYHLLFLLLLLFFIFYAPVCITPCIIYICIFAHWRSQDGHL